MPTLIYETRHGRRDGRHICGVDEVGRGPLAGPVTAAAVILPAALPRYMRKAIRDSKKMAAAEREALFDPLNALCLSCVAEASVAEIDTLNILWASMLAMQRAVAGLQTRIDIALIDGNRCPELACPAVAIIGGDDISLSIAAASILAKVTRDRFMARLASDHPQYGWERNAGYATPHHRQALAAHGPTPWHRRSFAPVQAACAAAMTVTLRSDQSVPAAPL